MGRKLKHASSKLKGLRTSGRTGFWEARKVIPAELRSAFGLTEFKQALNTKDENEAIRVGAAILADWQVQIDAARGRTALAAVPVVRHKIDADRAYDAIQRWKSARLKSAHTEAFNGYLDPAPVGFSDAMREHVQKVGDLRQGQWSAVGDFDAQLSDALNSQGIMCDPAHPAIPNLRPWFAHALADAEHQIMEYRKGHLADVPASPQTADPAPGVTDHSSNPPAKTKPGTTLMELFELYQKNKPTTVLARHRGYVTRLNEFLGEPTITSIEPLKLLAFRAQLERFPKTSKDISGIPFEQTIIDAKTADPNYRRLHPKTVWNWTQTYKAMFKFAVRNDLMPKNPAEHMMSKPSSELSDDRDPFDGDDIKAIFSTPLFQGASGNLVEGYRKEPGSVIERDHKYWLPLFCLFHGCRIEEIAAAKVNEFKVHEGIHYLDLAKRPAFAAPRRVKNANAKRLVPLHKRIIELGFLSYLADLDNDGFAFPLIGSEDNRSATKFISWWGRWADANAEKPDVGMDDPAKPLHSFRHTWMAASGSNPDVKERLSDLISGHAGDGNKVARHYGASSLRDPAILPILKPQIDLIDFPTFPVLPTP